MKCIFCHHQLAEVIRPETNIITYHDNCHCYRQCFEVHKDEIIFWSVELPKLDSYINITSEAPPEQWTYLQEPGHENFNIGKFIKLPLDPNMVDILEAIDQVRKFRLFE